LDALDGIFTQQRGPMLAPRVEEKARPRLDDQAEPQRPRLKADARHLAPHVARPGIEVRGVERDGAAAVAELGQQLQRLVETMVCHAVGVVTESQHVQAEAKRRPRRYAGANKAATAAPAGRPQAPPVIAA